MADVLNPERTESAHLNTELETPTLDVPAEPFSPSDEPNNHPQAVSPSVPHPAVDPRPVPSHSASEDNELTGMEDFAAALESFDREQAAEAAAQAALSDGAGWRVPHTARRKLLPAAGLITTAHPFPSRRSASFASQYRGCSS